jgi:DNA damage-binding protein 1
MCCSEWKPPSEKTISVVACNVTQLLCAAGSHLYYMEVQDQELVQKG